MSEMKVEPDDELRAIVSDSTLMPGFNFTQVQSILSLHCWNNF